MLKQIFSLYFQIIRMFFNKKFLRLMFKSFKDEWKTIGKYLLSQAIRKNIFNFNKPQINISKIEIKNEEKQTKQEEHNSVPNNINGYSPTFESEDHYWTVYTKKQSYSSQRDNKYNPYITCNVTSMINALICSGYEHKLPVKDGEQPEDSLYQFLHTNIEVLKFYEKYFPQLFYEWMKDKNNKNAYPPNEVHRVLAYGTNLWLNEELVQFRTDWKISEIFNHIIKTQHSVVQSVLWNDLNHVVSVQGLSGNKKISAENVLTIIIDDPYGNPYDKWKTIDGNNIIVPISDYYEYFKPNKNKEVKWAHLIL